jgi:speckle-type POZ protein
MEAFNWSDSGSVSVKVEFDWDFSAKFLETVDGKSSDLSSAFFDSREIPNHQWKLQLSDLGAKLRISLLHYVNTDGILANIVAPFQVKIAIVNKNRVKLHQHVVYSHIHTFVYFDLSKEEILKSNCRQVDGSLTISCVNECMVKKQPASGIPQPVGINCTHQLTTQLEELFDDMSFSDVIFKVGGSEFPAHKIILAARSEVFKAMFQHATKEKSTNHVEIDDTEPEIFKELLRFIYSGRLTAATMEKMAVGLLVVADKYLLTELKAACVRHLIRFMSIENCLELLLLSECNYHHPAYGLREEAINFFRLHPAEVILTDGWKKAKQENLALLFDVQEVAFCSKPDDEFRFAK